jgi:hypothetical protein
MNCGRKPNAVATMDQESYANVTQDSRTGTPATGSTLKQATGSWQTRECCGISESTGVFLPPALSLPRQPAPWGPEGDHPEVRPSQAGSQTPGRLSSMLQELQNTLFCPLQEKFDTVVFKGARNICGAL